MRNLIKLALTGALMFGLNSCVNKCKHDAEIELYDNRLNFYMEAEDSAFLWLGNSYKENVKQLVGFMNEKEGNHGYDKLYENTLENIKEHSRLRDSTKQLFLRNLKYIKTKFNE